MPERIFPEEVYPRWRGGTVEGFSTGLYEPGLSPLARGNRQGGYYPGLVAGSIPAGAGEPPPF